MSVTRYKTGKTPQQSQFGLDQFTEHWKCLETADVVLTDSSVPQKGDAHPDYPFMFVTDRYCIESGERSSALDLVYMGSLTESEGQPVLPPVKNSEDNPVQSATTYTSSAIFPLVATQPASVQFRGHSTSIVVLSTSDTSTAVCPDPPAVTVNDLITWTLVAEQPAGSLPGIADWILENGFVQQIIETTSAEEIVAGQYWQITKRKVVNLLPWAPLS